MYERNITGEFIEWLEQRNTKIAKKVLEKLDEEILEVYDYGGDPVIEKITSYAIVPNYVYHQYLLFKKEYLRKKYGKGGIL